MSTNSSYNQDEFTNFSSARINSSRRRRRDNPNIFQHIAIRNPTFKYNINQTIIKQNLKRIQKSKSKRTKLSQEKINWSTSQRKNLNMLRIGNTYDNRRKYVISDTSLNDFSFADTLSPKDTVQNFKPRKTNKTPIDRYLAINGANKLYRSNMPSNNVITGYDSAHSINKVKLHKTPENNRMQQTKYKLNNTTQRPTPRLF